MAVSNRTAVLIARARYSWSGIEILPDGAVASINTSDVAEPLGVAAHYDVEALTNFSQMSLPLKFKLTRFDHKQRKDDPKAVVATVIASVVCIKPLPVDVSPSAALPGKTFVNDYRLSAGALRGRHLAYVVDSTPLPATEQLKQSRL